MFQSVDNYCERLSPAFWAEPLNAVSNLSFILAALVVILLLRNKHDIASKILISILLAIGIGSFLFHTFAQQWAGIADVVPILLYILAYIYFATRIFLSQSPLISGLTVIAFFPFAAGASWLVSALLGPLNGSAAYVSVALLITIYGILMLRINLKTATGLFIGAGLLILSITFRSIDQSVCNSFPVGSHFVWHILNGIMLGWMILVLHKHAKD